MAVTSATAVSGVGGVSVFSRSPVDAVTCQNIFFPAFSDPPPSTGSLDPPEKQPTAAFSSAIICQIAITCEPADLPAMMGGAWSLCGPIPVAPCCQEGERLRLPSV